MAVKKVATINKYIGLSGDAKPTAGVPEGSLFHETDTNDTYIRANATWVLYKTIGSELWL